MQKSGGNLSPAKPHGRRQGSKMCLEVQGGHIWQSSNERRELTSVKMEGKQEKTGQSPLCCLVNPCSKSQRKQKFNFLIFTL